MISSAVATRLGGNARPNARFGRGQGGQLVARPCAEAKHGRILVDISARSAAEMHADIEFTEELTFSRPGRLKPPPETSTHTAKDERHQEQHECHEEDDLREPHRRSGYAAETEHSGNQSDDEKRNHEIQHCVWLQSSYRTIDL
jgi:hypothetical protein